MLNLSFFFFSFFFFFFFFIIIIPLNAVKIDTKHKIYIAPYGEHVYYLTTK